MADGLTLNAGSGGETLATDDAGAGGHVQIVKLAISTDGSATLIPAEASNGLDVDVTRIQAGDNVIGRVKLSDGTDVALITAAGQLTVLDGNSADALTALQAIETAVEGTLTVDGSASTQPISHAALTELAAAINASSQVDVNIAASGATVPISHAALTELAAAISTEVQVDVVGALPAGTNNIGDVDIASIAAGDNNIGNVDIASIAAGDNNIGNVDIASALPAGTNLLGRVSASLETGTIYQGTTAKTPVFASIDVASSGDNTIVTAQGASNKIRVHQLFLVSAGTVTARFESGAGGTALTGQMSLVANTGFVLPFSPIGWFETAANTLLNLELSAAVSVDGSLAYTVVT